jgi:hypothetical protein
VIQIDLAASSMRQIEQAKGKVKHPDILSAARCLFRSTVSYRKVAISYNYEKVVAIWLKTIMKPTSSIYILETIVKYFSIFIHLEK